MTKTILIFITLFFPLLVQAQNDFVSETYFGIKMGGNNSRLLSRPNIKQDLNNGLTGGIVFKHISQKSMGIQIELNYVQAGWTETLDGENAYTRHLNYIQLPFMSHLSLGNRTKFVFNLGPYVSYLLSENEDIYLAEGSNEEAYYGKEADGKGDFGLCVGLGVGQHTAIGLFQLEGRISSSLTDVFTSNPISGFSSSKILNAEISLYYLLDLKKKKK